jgi:hypothetical protein
MYQGLGKGTVQASRLRAMFLFQQSPRSRRRVQKGWPQRWKPVLTACLLLRQGWGRATFCLLICERINSLNDGVKKGSKTELDGA